MDILVRVQVTWSYYHVEIWKIVEEQKPKPLFLAQTYPQNRNIFKEKYQQCNKHPLTLYKTDSGMCLGGLIVFLNKIMKITEQRKHIFGPKNSPKSILGTNPKISKCRPNMFLPKQCFVLFYNTYHALTFSEEA